MKRGSRKEVKALIELSTTVEEADRIISEYRGFTTVEEKYAFLQGMFDVTVFHELGEGIEESYISMLTTIIDAKWNGIRP